MAADDSVAIGHLSADTRAELLVRQLAPQVLAALTRRTQDFSSCEDAVQEAVIAAMQQWPREGVPHSPVAWLVRTASRRLTDQARAAFARRRREARAVTLIPADEHFVLAADEALVERDDTLDLLFMCCHTALTPASQIALTLRAVGGLTTREIASAFLVPESTMAQRLSRAKETLRNAGATFSLPEPQDLSQRLGDVLRVLYLIFNEGYTPTEGDTVYRVDLAREAIRLTRLLVQRVEAPEAVGLLALMRLTDARRPARTGRDSELVPLDEQDRSLWDRAAIEEGASLVARALSQGAVGPYQVQAAIAALHDEARTWEGTDWPQILALYNVLLAVQPGPLVRLNRAVALAMVAGPERALEELSELRHDPHLKNHHRFYAVEAHLLERCGRSREAISAYEHAAALTACTPERNHLLLRAGRLAQIDAMR